MVESLAKPNKEIMILKNLSKLCESSKCSIHNDWQAEQLCTHSECIMNSTFFLCEVCVDIHNPHHKTQNFLKPLHSLFSRNLLDKLNKILDKQQSQNFQDHKLQEIFKQVDDTIDKFEHQLVKVIQDSIKKAKENIKASFQVDNIESNQIKKVISEYEEMLNDQLTNEDIPELKFFLPFYLLNYRNLTDVLHSQIQPKIKKDFQIDEVSKIFSQLTHKTKNYHDDLENLLKQKIEAFESDVLNDHRTYDESLIQRIKNSKFDKEIPKVHTQYIWKIIYYDNKIITCSGDNTIIIRNFENSKILYTLNEHKNWIDDLLVLQDGRLISCSKDQMIKIWNIKTGKCEQNLEAHKDRVYSMLELSDSILISASDDKSLAFWDLKNKSNPLAPMTKISNDNIKYPYHMTLINTNHIAISTNKDISIYMFDDTKSNIINIKTLSGHKDYIRHHQLVKSPSNLLLSSSNDSEIRLWNTKIGDCIRTYKGHTGNIGVILMISDRIFMSASKDIKFWHIDQTECLTTIKNDHSVYSLLKVSPNTILCCGESEKIISLKY